MVFLQVQVHVSTLVRLLVQVQGLILARIQVLISVVARQMLTEVALTILAQVVREEVLVITVEVRKVHINAQVVAALAEAVIVDIANLRVVL